MKKIIVLLVFMVLSLGCSNESSSDAIQGQWSSQSFKLQLYAEQQSNRNTATGEWTAQPVKQYTEDRTFEYNVKGFYEGSVAMVKVSNTNQSDYVYSNENTIMKLADYWDHKYSGKQYDFSIDKQIYETIEDGIIIKKVTYFYR
jgi:hypothetical protein